MHIKYMCQYCRNCKPERGEERIYCFIFFLLKILQETFKGSNLTRVGTLRKKETKTEVPIAHT